MKNDKQGYLFDSHFQHKTPLNEENSEELSKILRLSREISGCPLGHDIDLLTLSCFPEYTAFPNPALSKWLTTTQEEKFDKEPIEAFAIDVSEGKNDPYYATFNYHTKVPPLAIAQYILHYTKPGETVADFFCGSGMTGLATQFCSRPPKDAPFAHSEKLGERRCVLVDLSPIATFLSYAFTRSVDGRELETEASAIVNEAEREIGWLYQSEDGHATMDYAVWSDILLCPSCDKEFSFWDGAIDPITKEDRKTLVCPHCAAETTIREAPKAWEQTYDPIIGQPVKRVKDSLVVVYEKHQGHRRERGPSTTDLAVIERARNEIHHIDIPIAELPDGYNTRQPRESHGIGFVHQFYTWRNLFALGWLHQRVRRAPRHLRPILTVIVLALHARASRRNRHIPKYGHRHVGVLSGTLYVPPLREEPNLIHAFYQRARKAARSIGYRDLPRCVRISTQSATDLRNIPSESIDYIFVDPPFGANIMYSELNYLWEAWLGVYTNNSPEAIVNDVQGKGLRDYEEIMEQAFCEFNRTLRPGRWMTVVFHNSKNSVWVAIQEALQRAGFVIADVHTLDKRKGTIKQLSTANAARQDLVISAYKPNGGLEDRFKLTAGTEEGVWDFIRTHLKHLPVFVSKDGKAEVIAERQNYLLFDRMVAFHVQRGVTVPLSAAEFYAGLDQRFPERDGMYFLPEQVAEYDKKRMNVKEVLQLQLFVTDEASAIQWLKQQLTRKPQTFQELHPQFLKEIGGWQKHEKPLELSELLEQNLLRYDGKGPIPAQIVSWMKQSAELRKKIQEELASGRAAEENGQLSTQSSVLITRAKDRWYVPDPNKASDLEKLRERALLREFEEYRESKQKRLKVFRLEAVRAGFKKAWQERDYATIITVARKVPENVLQEDPKLLMWYDQALTRSGEDA